jgi:hypothetical protein
VILTGGRVATIAIGIPIAIGVMGWSAFTMVGTFAHASEHHEASYPWNGGAISLRTSAGSVRIESGTVSTVEVAYTEHYELKKPKVTGVIADGGVQLTAACPGGIFGNNCEINYVVTLPASARLVVHTGSGSVQLADLAGALSVDAGDGGITFDSVSGDIVAHTGNGGIHGTAVQSKSVDVSTGDGSINLAWASAPTSVTAMTGNGGIALVLPSGSGPYRVATSTGNGGQHVSVPTDIGARSTISARTGDGSIKISYPVG